MLKLILSRLGGLMACLLLASTVGCASWDSGIWNSTEYNYSDAVTASAGSLTVHIKPDLADGGLLQNDLESVRDESSRGKEKLYIPYLIPVATVKSNGFSLIGGALFDKEDTTTLAEGEGKGIQSTMDVLMGVAYGNNKRVYLDEMNVPDPESQHSRRAQVLVERSTNIVLGIPWWSSSRVNVIRWLDNAYDPGYDYHAPAPKIITPPNQPETSTPPAPEPVVTHDESDDSDDLSLPPSMRGLGIKLGR